MTTGPSPSGDGPVVISPATSSVGRAVAALALGGFAIGVTEFVAMGLLPEISAGTGVDIPTAGHYISAYAAGVVVGAPAFAIAFAKAPRKGLLMGLMALFAVANTASFFAVTYPALMVTRFVSGLPHGAYFGIAMLLAASLVEERRRTWAVAMILAGLGIANVVGVPLGTWVGQHLGWGLPFVGVGALATLTVLAVARWVPKQASVAGASPLDELRALRHVQVWLALLIGIVGFGGMFATYAYISPTMTTIAGFPSSLIPAVLTVYGLGMVAGMALAGPAGERLGVLRGIIVLQALLIVMFLAFAPALRVTVLAWVFPFILGVVPSVLVPLLQTRLMDVAHEGQALAATLNHATLNVANGLGAWLGSLVLAAGLGYEWPSRVEAILAVLGLLLALLSQRLERPVR